MPEHVTGSWMDSLTDGDLLTAESRLHKSFSTIEKAQKKLLGSEYELMRGSPELLAAWGCWSRVSTEARVRRLHVRRTRKR